MNVSSVDNNEELIIQQLLTRPGFMMRRGFHEVRNYFETACSETGLTAQQYDVLYVLSFVPHMLQTSIGHFLTLDKSTTALVIKKLETKGHIERKTLASDSRQRVVRLTAQGHEVLEQAADAAQGSQQVVKDILGDRDYRQLLKLLAKLVNALDYQRNLAADPWDED
ncbi:MULTISPECIES: MarR family winged helix-turn-helix transcriptional regulator [Pseudomonas]|jgi:DNA-binding MarR family transcriptional regulator|uniref:MarR family winged helix-turn-helix transcriptional regulator n=1 Tax=Pseudomonas TaxID=286 RepID=UPI000B870A68|nr:MarR family winged helix-turn-helix transcriptional regulator [Pseudomonas marincola]MBQ53960.1 MarR family transcriptional regulator [Pseudomonadaceae bacterium]HCP55425.1 MarR family transcriptional regulator [Pseudomonas sp.]|tara:strand:+ start:337 stop:837 length:501 start_codon:yes stop_codon:yes gene_type:complete